MKYANLEKDYQWYLNTGIKREASIYAKAKYDLNDELSVYGDLQYRYIFYKMEGTMMMMAVYRKI